MAVTLIEAVKSGKKFKRKEEGQDSIYEDLPEGQYLGFRREDILADDWEVEASEPEKITVTAEQVRTVLYNNCDEFSVIKVLKELGFKEL